MARSGKFGRLPRTAPDISSAIIALAREFIAAEERNYVDAWNNGGEVDGVRVTDEVLLAFFRKRRDGLNPKDPDWDKYDNVLGQYEFAIENSKMELKYAEGKVDDAGMAKFYREQAGKHPVDSEIYRRLRTLAAQYSERATRAASRGSRGSSSAGYDASVNKIMARKEWGYDTFWDFVEQQAKQRGILVKENQDLMDLRVDESDYTRLNDLLFDILESDEWAPWRKQYTDQMRKYDPNFQLDLAYLANSKKEGVTARHNLAVNNGKRGDATDTMKELGEVGSLQGRLLLRDPLQQYEDARAALDLVLEDPDSDPMERWNAVQDYIGAIEGIANDVSAFINGPNGGFEGSNTIIGRLNNELTVLYGGDVVGGTLWDDASSATVADADATSTAESRKALAEQINDLASGASVLMRGDDIEGFGTGWVVVPIEAVAAAEALSFAPVTGSSRGRTDGSGNPISQQVPSITIRGADGGSKTTMLPTLQYATVGLPVVARAAQLDPVTGRPVAGISPAESQRLDVAYRFEMPDGSVLWSYWDVNGVRRWSNAAPFAEGLAPIRSLDGRSYVVDLPGQEEGWTADAVIGQDFFNNPDSLSLTVFQSSAIAWMMSRDPDEAVGTRAIGTANPRALEVAIISEFGGNTLAAQSALAEASDYRATYLRNTPDAQRQLMSAFQRGLTPALPSRTSFGAEYDSKGRLIKPGVSVEGIEGLREAGGEGALMRQYINMYRTGQTTAGVNEDGDFILRANPMDVGTIRPFHQYSTQRGLSFFGPPGQAMGGLVKSAMDFNKLLKGELETTVGPNLPKGPAQVTGGPVVNPSTGFVTQPPTAAPPPSGPPAGQVPQIPTNPPGAPVGPPNIPTEEFDEEFNPPPAPPPPPSGGRPPAAPIPV